MASDSQILFDQLQQHVVQVQADPSIKLDERLFGSYEWYAQENLNDVWEVLLPQLLALLASLQQDPQPVTKLITNLVEPFSFGATLALAPPATLLEALQSPSASVMLLALTVLKKAESSASDTAILAGMKDLVASLIRMWLTTPEVGVAETAAQLLRRMLEVDLPKTPADSPEMDVEMGGVPDTPGFTGSGQGLMWRRIFDDRDIYGLFFTLTISETEGKTQRTLAQARLLGLLPSLARLDWNAVTRSRHADIETRCGLTADNTGLLEYAAIHMVDFKDDILMHMSLIGFFTELLTIHLKLARHLQAVESSKSAMNRQDSPGLDYLISKGLHQRTVAYYLDPTAPHVDPSDQSFIAPRSATYLATYCTTFPNHLLSAPSLNDSDNTRSRGLLDDIKSHISMTLSANGAFRTHIPKHDLHLLASLPRSSLLRDLEPRTERDLLDWWSRSPLSAMPVNVSNEDLLNTLATIFKGPNPRPSYDDTQSSLAPVARAYASTWMIRDYSRYEEIASARALCLLYLHHRPQFVKSLVGFAETAALKDGALAAINVMHAIVGATWAELPAEPPLPASSAPSTDTSTSSPNPQPNQPLHPDQPPPLHITEPQLRHILSHHPLTSFTHPPITPPTNRYSPPLPLTTLLSPPCLSTLIPYLCSPPQTFTNLVGGTGDAESAAYKIARLKYETLRLLHRKLGERMAYGTKDDVVKEVAELVAQAKRRGAWGDVGAGERGVASRIATLEL